MRSSMENGRETRTVYLELLNFYTPFGWFPTEPVGKKLPSPINKVYDGGNPFSVEKNLNYFEDDIKRNKKQKKIKVERSNRYLLNARLTMEEYWLEFWMRRKYRLYPHRKKLVLKHRCRPIWGTIWAILMLFFAVVLTSVLCHLSSATDSAFVDAFRVVYDAMTKPIVDFLYSFRLGDALNTTEDEFVKIFSACGVGVFGFLFIRQCFESWRNQFVTRQLLTACVNALNITSTMKKTDAALRRDVLAQKNRLRAQKEMRNMMASPMANNYNYPLQSSIRDVHSGR